MKKLLLALMLFPAVAVAQPSAKYQPPTPTPWFNTTPGAPAQVINAWAADQFGRPQVVAIGSSAAPLAPDIVATGTLDMTNASDTEVFSCDGRATVGIQFNRGTETGTIQFDYTTDNTTWIRIYEVFIKANSGAPLEINEETSGGNGLATVATLNSKIFLFDCAGKRSIRVAVQATGTGTALPIAFRGSDSPSGLIQNVRPGTTARSLGKAEDAAHASGDVGVMALSVRNDSGAALTSTDLDYSPLAVNSKGANFVDIQSGLSANIATSILKLEDAVHASGDAGVACLGRAVATPGLSGAAGDYVTQDVGPEGGQYTQAIAGSVGGATIARVISAANNNATVVKASAGSLHSVTACNINAAVRYLKLYNKATAPTCGTDTPVATIPLPVNNCAPVSLPGSGLAFTTGIGICIVTGAADTDNTATAVNEQFVTIGYK